MPLNEIEGTVIFAASARCRVFSGGREIDCAVPPDIARRQRSTLTVGDRVLAENAEGAWRVREVLARRTALSRPDPLNPRVQRLIAANIDIVVHVVSLKSPPLRPRLIDRVMIAVQRGGARPAICVNKIDLLSPEEREPSLSSLQDYSALSIPVIACSASSGEGIGALRELIAGKMCAFVGHSGVGKSSILNALDARLNLSTGELRRRGTGRHTTTSSTLHDLGGDTLVIDTPGVREFGLWDLTAEELRQSFPEFEEAAEWCRFNDCTHLHEPDCEVKRRVESGAIGRQRYEAYARLAKELS